MQVLPVYIRKEVHSANRSSPTNCDFRTLPGHSLTASRMQRWALLLSAHTYDIKYRKSELHGNADGLSSLPLPNQIKEAETAEIFYFGQVEGAPVTAAQVRKSTQNDPVLSKVMDVVMTGKGETDDLLIKPYIICRHELSVQSGCLL